MPRAEAVPSLSSTTASDCALQKMASPSKYPHFPFPTHNMLPSEERLPATAQSMPHTLKGSLVALGHAQRHQSLPEIMHRPLRRSRETRNLLRTTEQWKEVQRCSRGPPHNIAQVPLDNKALLNPSETLPALYVSRFLLQGPWYPNRGDPIRWAHLWRFVELLLQDALPAGTNYIRPRHLWEMQSGNARGADLRLPEVGMCIDISWYRRRTQVN